MAPSLRGVSVLDPARGPHARRAAERAALGWAALERVCVERDRRGHLLVRQGVRGQPAFLWPYSQVLHAAVVLDRLRPGAHPVSPELLAGLASFRRGPALADSVGGRQRYFDDNAWVGLAEVAAGERAMAEATATWVRTGEDPRGGVAWREGLDSRHACSTGAAALLVLRLAEGAGADRTGALAFARRCRAFLAGPLARPDGLVADHVDADGRVQSTAWTYNQGLALGVDVLLHRAGEAAALDRARELAGRTLAHFREQDRMWRQPPAFVAVLMRLLLLLHAADGDPAWPAAVDGYLERVWDVGRDPDSGVFRAGGIGRYDEGIALDQAALVGLLALRALPPDVAAELA